MTYARGFARSARVAAWLCIAFTSPVMGQDFYVRQGASGGGGDWSNAYGSLPSTLQRGATYWLADGSYPAYTFDDPQSGSTTITIRKASASSHGTNTGWQAGYGDGQARFSRIRFSSSYYVLDGAYRNEDDWSVHASYGIGVNISAGTGDQDAYGLRLEGVSNIVVNCVSTEGSALSDFAKGMKLGKGTAPVSNITISRVRLGGNHDDAIKMPNASNILIERCYIGPRILSPSGKHGDAIEIWTSNNVIYRYNIQNYAGDGIHYGIGVSFSDNWQIYGNVFRGIYGTGHTAIKVNSKTTSMGSVLVYNNTFHDVDGAANIRAFGSSFDFKNNIMSDVRASIPGGATNVIVSQDPFVNVGAGDFHLDPARAGTLIDKGVALGSAFGTDASGAIRGADGLWDIGAFEGPGVPDLLPPTAPGNLNATPVSEFSIQLVWTASVDNRSVWRYRIFRDGIEVGTSLVPAFTDTGLIPQTTYSYTAIAEDGAGNASPPSNTAGATTLSPDTQAPTTPTGLTGQANTAFTIQLVWNASTDDRAVAGYRIYRDGFLVGTSETAGFVDRSLTPETAYSYRVSAYDATGNESALSVGTGVTTLEGLALDEGLIAAYDLNEGDGQIATDITGNGYDGELIGPGWSAGQFRGALDFDGESDAVTFDGLDFTADALTITLWMKADTFTINDGRLISKSTGSAAQDHDWMISTIENGGPKLRFRLKTLGVTSTLIADQSALDPNTWIHVAAVYDGSRMSLYQDAELVGGMPKTGTLVSNPAVKASLGRNFNGYGAFNGKIDEVRIYGRALSASEIRDVMLTPLGGESQLPALSSAAHWRIYK